ncbi:MAG: hypothetical protein HYW62_00400 [Candidatus Levybacteria bacterium]|nr:hypothetical protein [Candidatus Levybacteria bacterium]
MNITSYEEAINYLEGFIGKVVFKINKEFLKKRDPLQRMRILLSLLGNPQEKFRSVLVGGTSGKGSTAYLISHILTVAGYKTGFTVSPHLQKVNERLQINNKSISNENFLILFKSIILPSIRQMSKMEVGPPSYFEILVAMGFKHFADQKVDIAVAEVGMGGEFDATNTLNPLIAVLTNVGLDHTNILGKTVSKIARTKAGIIKTGATPLVVVSGVRQPTVIKIVEDRCRKVGAKLNLLWRNFGYKIKKINHEGSVFDLTVSSGRGLQLNDLSLSFLGDYQVENASLAIKTILELRELGFSHNARASRDKKISDSAIRKALKTSFFPGRFEVIHVAQQPRVSDDARQTDSNPSPNSASLSKSRLQSRTQPTFSSSESGLSRSNHTLILDSAHNPTKMRAFLATLKKLYPKEKKVFLVGFKFDKDIQKMLKQIIKVADEIIITEFNRATDMNLHASADAESIKYQVLSIKYSGKIIVEKDSKKALKIGIKTIQQFNNETILVVTGSLYLVGEIRGLLTKF